ncbi:MAG: hypothetical protein COB53_12020 [Elusimicrobia bacterium]|nr:MAG: hypothetical protein COB53_12020 [Elusimicrobiota bacterium]
MKPKAWIPIGILLLAAFPTHAAIGLTSSLMDIVLEDIEPGKDFNILKESGNPYLLTNRGNAPILVRVEVLRPRADELKPGYEPIPDARWISAEPNLLNIKSSSRMPSSLVIRVPDDSRLAGRHFMAVVWSHSVSRSLISVGVKSYIRFSTGSGLQVKETKRAVRAEDLHGFTLRPSVVAIRKARAGRYDPKRKEKLFFELTNRSDATRLVSLHAQPWTGAKLPKGFSAATDLGWVRFSPSSVKIKPGKTKRVRIKLRIPKNLRGKKIAFFIETRSDASDEPGPRSRILVRVRP